MATKIFQLTKFDVNLINKSLCYFAVAGIASIFAVVWALTNYVCS